MIERSSLGELTAKRVNAGSKLRKLGLTVLRRSAVLARQRVAYDELADPASHLETGVGREAEVQTCLHA